MARTRLIHPGAPLEEDVATMSLGARLLWAYLPCYADREGRLKDSAFTLKAAVFPADNIDVNAILDELAKARHIIRYEVDGKRVIQIRSFRAYQSPHKNENESTIPPPPGVQPPVLTVPHEDSRIVTTAHECSLPSVSGSGDRSGEIPPPARDPSGTAQGLEREVAAEAIRTALEEDAPRKVAPLTGVALGNLFGKVRAKVIGGAEWQGTRCKPEVAANRAAEIVANHAEAEVERTMWVWWERVKAGDVDDAQKCLDDDAFSFGCWWSKFRSLRDQVLGVAKAAPATGRATGPPRGPDRTQGNADALRIAAQTLKKGTA